MKTKYTTKWRQVDGCRTRVRIVPPALISATDAPTLPLLLLHGLGCASDAWLPTLRWMADARLPAPTLAPDFPGYGHSECPKDALDMRELADFTIHLMDLYSIERAHLVGSSMGCQVAMAMARYHKHRVGGMVLQGPTMGSDIISPARYVVGLIADSIFESPAYNILLMRMYAQMGVPRYLKTVQFMLDDDPVGHIDEITAPTLVVRGGFDRIIPDSAARKLADLLPDASYVPLDHTAHAIEFTAPELFVPATLNFLYRAEPKLRKPTD